MATATSRSRKSATPPVASQPWIYRPWLDLLVGCGAWSAPLLILVYPMATADARASAIAFYALALIFNYPHYMATVYRAYHTRVDFEKYRIFTVHLTGLLVLTAVLTHASPRLLPWIFTLYINWSPWHYTGQNYGLLMMFARRNGAEPTPGQRRALWWSFLCSYLLLLLTMHREQTGDPLVLSLGIPSRIALPLWTLFTLAFLSLGSYALVQFSRRTGVRAMLAPITLFTTQFLWFVLPSALQVLLGWPIPQTRYATGILAVMHSAQYLWITSYYAQRESAAEGKPKWRPWAYFVILIAGGIALFVPGPWLVSYLFHYDFTASFLVFTALVNIHHFMLDGAIWKLRDGRIAALLLDTRTRLSTATNGAGTALGGAARWLTGSSPSARALRIGAAVLLFLWAGMDQVRYILGGDSTVPALVRAASLAPYDTAVQMRLARAQAATGDLDQAVASLHRAIDLDRVAPAPQNALAQLLLESGRYPDAYAHYRQMLTYIPRDANAWINFGILATRLGHPEEATQAWQKALELDPKQLNAHLYLADALLRDKPKDALVHYQAYLQGVQTNPQAYNPDPRQVVYVLLQSATASQRVGALDASEKSYLSAVNIAQTLEDKRLLAVALANLADLEDRMDHVEEAMAAWQRTLKLDTGSHDAAGRAKDWFNYGQFLRRRGAPARLAYACFVKSEEILRATPGPELEMARSARSEVRRSLGAQTKPIDQDPSDALAQATALSLNQLLVRR